MACRPARQAESSPYCILAMATTEQIRRHFLFAHTELSGKCAATAMLSPMVLSAHSLQRETSGWVTRCAFERLLKCGM